jgi:hypothetical protein
MITETSHIGDNRGPWLLEVVQAAETLLREGAPLRGVCLYPILGMPEWHQREIWTPMGLWDPVCHKDPGAGRSVCEPMLAALRSAGKLEALHRQATAQVRRLTVPLSPGDLRSCARRDRGQIENAHAYGRVRRH